MNERTGVRSVPSWHSSERRLKVGTENSSSFHKTDTSSESERKKGETSRETQLLMHLTTRLGDLLNE
ncbi:hypothetical protein GWI33_022152 [Rhynchophorus ferrugineus]|uniref:Uncharacterized protein n=1 Tax=Rhynchophorus ferrugineus TaxID=354439 RepID=A0A834INI1_RHYFE|nr:hypothetical protein GWI33_022152 [Rhynchophorus ferrugineus]